MGELLSQDDLNALLGLSPERKQRAAPGKEAAIVSVDMGSLLSQDDLDALLPADLSGARQTQSTEEATVPGVELGSLLSQDDLNALLGGASEDVAAPEGEVIPNPEARATQTDCESMSQDEIDDLLRQFDRDI
jgi:flagellar motor switch protein FliM